MELMKGYKKSEIGSIPIDWKLLPLGKLFDFKNGVNADKTAYGSGVKFINVMEVFGGNEISYNSIKGKVQLSKDQINIYKVRKGDILFNRTSETFEDIALASIYIDSKEVVFGGFVIRASHLSQELYPPFTQSILRSNKVRKQIISLSQGAIRANIGQADLSKVFIPIPSLPEQQAISKVLSDTDKLIQFLEKKIAKKKLIKQGVMQRLLTPKDDWEVKKLGDFLVYEQPTKYLVSNTDYNDNYDIPVLTAGKSFILGHTNEKNGVFTKLPAIIFDDFTTASKYVDFPFKAKSSAMKILKPANSKIDLRFIYELMQQIDFPVGDHKRHWIGEFQHLEILIPKPQEQKYISEQLTNIESEIKVLERKLSKYRLAKQGIMQQLLTGKIRLSCPEK